VSSTPAVRLDDALDSFERFKDSAKVRSQTTFDWTHSILAYIHPADLYAPLFIGVSVGVTALRNGV
jgi:hypothetical protein